MKRLDAGELGDATALALLCDAARGIQVCHAGVVVVDLGSEEFEDAPGGFGGWREERRRRNLIDRIEDDLVAHRLCRGAMVGGLSVAVTLVRNLPYHLSSVIKDVELSRCAAAG